MRSRAFRHLSRNVRPRDRCNNTFVAPVDGAGPCSVPATRGARLPAMAEVLTDIADGVAVVTLDAPDRRNALDARRWSTRSPPPLDAVEADPTRRGASWSPAPPRRSAPAPTCRTSAPASARACCASTRGSCASAARRCPASPRSTARPWAPGSTSPSSATSSSPARRPASTPGSCSSASTRAAATPGCCSAASARRPPRPWCCSAAILDGRRGRGRRAGLGVRARRRAARHRPRDGRRRGGRAPRAGRAHPGDDGRRAARIDDHGAAVERELDPQVWSINQPAFQEKLAALQRRISSEAARAARPPQRPVTDQCQGSLGRLCRP